MNRVIHFEISAENAERAAKFYEDVFGWESPRSAGQKYWLLNSGNEKEQGINGGMFERKDIPIHNAFIIHVKNIDEYIEKIKSHGGKVVIDKRGIQGVGFAAYFEDTEGNTFGILQPPDEPAASNASSPERKEKSQVKAGSEVSEVKEKGKMLS